MSQTLQEYLINVRYNVDAASQGRFVEALTKAARSVSGVAAEITALAGAVTFLTEKLADAGERLHFMSGRLASSIGDIQQTAAAMSNLGVSASEAMGAMESFGAWTRQMGPGATAQLRSLGVTAADATGRMNQLRDALRNLGMRPGMEGTWEYSFALQRAQQMGLSERVARSLTADEYPEQQRRYGLIRMLVWGSDDPDATAERYGKKANEVMNQFRFMGFFADQMRQKFALGLFGAMLPHLEKLNVLIQGLKPGLDRLFDSFNRIAVPALMHWLEGLVRIFGDVLKVTNSLIEAFGRMPDSVGRMVQAFGTIAVGLMVLSSPLGRILTLLGALALLIDDFMAFKAGGKSYYDWSMFEKMVAPLGQAATALNEFIKSITGLEHATEWIVGGTLALAFTRVGRALLRTTSRVTGLTRVFRDLLGLSRGAGAAGAGAGAGAGARALGGEIGTGLMGTLFSMRGGIASILAVVITSALDDWLGHRRQAEEAGRLGFDRESGGMGFGPDVWRHRGSGERITEEELNRRLGAPPVPQVYPPQPAGPQLLNRPGAAPAPQPGGQAAPVPPTPAPFRMLQEGWDWLTRPPPGGTPPVYAPQPNFTPGGAWAPPSTPDRPPTPDRRSAVEQRSGGVNVADASGALPANLGQGNAPSPAARTYADIMQAAIDARAAPPGAFTSRWSADLQARPANENMTPPDIAGERAGAFWEGAGGGGVGGGGAGAGGGGGAAGAGAGGGAGEGGGGGPRVGAGEAGEAGGGSGPAPDVTFRGTDRQRAAAIRDQLARDLNISRDAASGLVGNLQAESGLRAINERNPTVPGSRGGFGWAQWTGPRRVAFERYAAQHGLDVRSDQANYGFLVHELQNNPYYNRRVLQPLQQGHHNARQAGAFVEEMFEGPLHLHPDVRGRMAQEASQLPAASQSALVAQADAALRPRVTPPLGMDGNQRQPIAAQASAEQGGGGGITQTNNTTITVSGAGDPNAVGAAVAREQGRVNENQIRLARSGAGR